MKDYKPAAIKRIDNTPELSAHKAILLTAHFFTLDEHYEWVATAPVADIVEWAIEVEEEEEEQEAAYYAYLESQMAAPAVAVPEDDSDDDDQGYCGPTCGKYGNW